MRTIAITGATGFLGRHIVGEALKREYKVVAFGNSESRMKEFEGIFPNVPLYTVDISNDAGKLKRIFREHEVDFVVHTAALKHVGICEKNVARAIEVNITGTKNVLDASNDTNVKNCILISTDKSINPTCVYGMTKLLNEKAFQECGFGIFQGVNFLYSAGSVLDIWEKQMKNSKKISVNGNAIRYFTLVSDVSRKILDNIETRLKFTVDECHKIKIADLQAAFSEYWKYDNVDAHNLLDVEKVEEEIPLGVKVLEPSVSEIAELIRKHKIHEVV